MRDIKLRRKMLRKELIALYQREYTPGVTEALPWQLLDRLVRDCNVNSSSLVASISEAIERRDPLAYLNLQTYADPQMYGSAAEYKSAAFVLSFLKKYPFGKVTGVDPRAKAESRFFEAERLCRATNKRLKWYRRFPSRLDKHRRDLHWVLHSARLKIGNWLGPLDLDKIYDYTRHGPGGSIGVTGDGTTAYFKYMLSPYTVTTRALPYAEAAILTDPLWRRMVVNQCSIIGDHVPTVEAARSIVRSQLKVADYNKVTFVPKTALTHRAIAVEPTMNIFLQLGVGDWMTDLLSHFGTNLRSQVRNQKLAYEGSKWTAKPEDSPVTLDLSMASDTLSDELARDLLPDEWYSFLSDLRSPSGVLGELKIHWAKFSSMGNGFTFPLETMIFKALAESVASLLGYDLELISIYGDDIICPQGMALKLVEVLAFAGFTTNTEKSFFFGHFRESCGSDWFQGEDVRPFFLRRKIKSDKDLIFILNSFGGLYGSNAGDPPDCSVGPPDRIITYAQVKALCYGRLNQKISRCLRGPRTEGLEGHIHAPWDLAQVSELVLWDRDYQAWSYHSVKANAVKYRGRPGPLYLQMVSGLASNPEGDRLSFFIDSLDETLLGYFDVEGLNPRRTPFWLRGLALATIAGEGGLTAVTYRNRTKLSITTQTCHGWRNDDASMNP